MTSRLVVYAALGVLFAVLASASSSCAEELPEGPNRELVRQTCTACHEIENLLRLSGADRAVWENIIDEMASNGLRVTPEERGIIVDYLVTYLGPGRRTSHGANGQ
jgi:hypothetical protein